MDAPLDIKEASQYLGVSRQFLYGLTMKKQIKHYKPTGKIFFLESDLDDWLQAGVVEATWKIRELINIETPLAATKGVSLKTFVIW